MGTPNEHPLICEVIPPQFRSTALGIFNTSGTAAGGLGVLFAGVFKADLGLPAIFSGASFFFALSGLAMLLAYFAFATRDAQRAASYGHSEPC
jgi:hypothetical protein